MDDIHYGGFWWRFFATMIDTALLIFILIGVFIWAYGGKVFLANSEQLLSSWFGIFLQYIFPIIATLLFWHYRSATPGKMICGLKITDANTLGQPTTKQFVIRYFAYIVSMLPLCLGFLWIVFDKRKQAWHDKLAKTLVIKT